MRQIYLWIATVKTFPSMGYEKPDSDAMVWFLLIVWQFAIWNISALSSYHHISPGTEK